MINTNLSSNESSAVYIHIPFCEHICYYCDFNKVFLEGQPVDEYVDLLIKEMELTVAKGPIAPVDTVFVGGGTPTTLNEAQIARLCTAIHNTLPLKKDIEFSFEANPGDLSLSKLQAMQDHGVNRISMGVQSFNNELLKKIGRIHTVKDVYQSVENMRKIGFENVSIDLIFSLPGQTEADFQDTLKQALDLDLPHYSAYSLIIEPKTIFYNLMQKGKLFLPGQRQICTIYFSTKWKSTVVNNMKLVILLKKDFRVNTISLIGAMNITTDLAPEHMAMLAIHAIAISDQSKNTWNPTKRAYFKRKNGRRNVFRT
ncbi:Oxygen-independent coproporphyrinogen-III oxidase 1 [Listeria monocytogenes]|nr:Oxygen-independent coproporphyrinogen-III oxidase 1 [Listeria monocytogenes]